MSKQQFTVVAPAHVHAVIKAESEAEAIEKWRRLRLRLNTDPLAPGVELLVEGHGAVISADAGRDLTGRHQPRR